MAASPLVALGFLVITLGFGSALLVMESSSVCTGIADGAAVLACEPAHRDWALGIAVTAAVAGSILTVSGLVHQVTPPLGPAKRP